MALLSWLPWLVDDWLTSPTRLTMDTTERAVYQDLLAYQWKDGYVPADHQRLAIMAAVSLEKFEAAAPVVLKHFNLKNGRYRNAKLAVLRKSAMKKLSAQERKSQKGGMAKARKHKEMPTTGTLEAPLRASNLISSSLSEEVKLKENSTARAREILVTAESNQPKYDPSPGWRRFRVEYPCIPNEDFAFQQWLSVIETAEEEAVQWAGLAAYQKSQRAKDEIWYEAHNWLRDRRYRGKYPAARDSAESELRKMRSL